MKVKLLADYWSQRQTDEDGEKYYVMRKKGDEFEVTDAESRHLLRDDLPLPMAEEVKPTQQAQSTSSTSTAKK